MGDTVTESEAKPTNSPGRHEGYYISKANQTIHVPSGERFEFLAEELINVEYSHKVCLPLRHAWLRQLTTGPVQRTRHRRVVHEREPSSDPTLDGSHLPLLVMASRETAVYISPPQIARRGHLLEPFPRPLCRRVGNHVVRMGHGYDGNDFPPFALRETD